jgi:hypothetical protein
MDARRTGLRAAWIRNRANVRAVYVVGIPQGGPLDAQLLISHIRSIGVTRVHERARRDPGDQKFVRIITVRYADSSEYQICLTAEDVRCLQLSEEDPPAP